MPKLCLHVWTMGVTAVLPSPIPLPGHESGPGPCHPHMPCWVQPIGALRNQSSWQPASLSPRWPSSGTTKCVRVAPALALQSWVFVALDGCQKFHIRGLEKPGLMIKQAHARL